MGSANGAKLSATMIGCTATIAMVVVQAQIPTSLASVAINQKVKEVVVRIDGVDNGSGVIINRQGDTYVVLTNWHVVRKSGEYTIQTSDGQSHSVDYRQVKRLLDVDLALIYFRSNKKYSIAQRGNSDKLQEGQTIYIGGYPGSQNVAKERGYRFYTENLIGFLPYSNITEGYELIYSGEAQPGMSGSPIIDENGNLIGIYGLVDINNIGSSTLFGIPINTAVKLLQREGIDLDSSVATSSKQPPVTETLNTISSSSQQLVGTWRAKVFENGQQLEVTAHLKPDGTHTLLLQSSFQRRQIQGYWRYSEGILYETDALGNSAKSSITWISDNEVILTIIDNGNPANTGVQRRYYRQ